jgi:hypothetical protein
LEAASGYQKLGLEIHKDADVVRHGRSPRLREAFRAVLEAAEEVVGVMFGISIDVSSAALEIT